MMDEASSSDGENSEERNLVDAEDEFPEIDGLEELELNGAHAILNFLRFHDFARDPEETRLRDFPRLPVPVEALKGETRQDMDLCTTDKGVKRLLERTRSEYGDFCKAEGCTDDNVSGASSFPGLGGREVQGGGMDAVEDAGGTALPSPSRAGPVCPLQAWFASKCQPKERCCSQESCASTSLSQSSMDVDINPAPSPGRAGNLINRLLGRASKSPAQSLVHENKVDGAKPGKASGDGKADQWGNVHHMIGARELGMCRGGGFSRSQQCHVLCGRRIPAHPTRVVEELPSRGYIGQFSEEGDLFVAAFQDKCIRIYDVQYGWRLRKNIHARMLRWTITDTAISPDGRLLLYSSITPYVHLVNIGSYADGIESISNVTDIHDSLAFGETSDGSRHMSGSTVGIWSLAWSRNGYEIIAGTSDCSIMVYDLESRTTTTSVQGHLDDVNAVAFVDDSANVFVSGSDDALVKVWDRRMLGPRHRAAGVLVGHTEGVTHIDSKGDGHCLISNCKDQTIKLWDLRKSVTEETLARRTAPRLPQFHWDYRWSKYPGEGFDIAHPDDSSLMTYRGHGVLKTLIRAHFSPAFTTGQRYIYTGSCTGSLHVFDVVTGEEVETLQHHVVPVRDCAWHPTAPMLASVGWDGCIVLWAPRESCREDHSLLRRPSGDKYDF
ncbi:unnamed protein product [Ostreobium quekettii]|uniref:Uncharacterized protein n=1 Tax=Ostreobium quekettii TaxID=121088 RepID=A0A8S1J7E4_9CHLO|nr:unnamed protein product [Ostreobium quekettii]|eukprot:evm.model.scf_407EXC.5 EVM.evm.TU.scf_407EXC.5   scf_407EXC:57769-59766(-)